MDRDATWWGPVLPQDPDAPEAFSPEQLERIQRARAEIDRERAQVWSTRPRLDSIRPYSWPKPV